MNKQKQILQLINLVLKKKGYSSLKILFYERYLIGEIKKEKKIYFFKMSKSQNDNSKLINEYKSRALIKRKLQRNNKIIIDKLFKEKGFIKYKNKRLFYFISDYIRGRSFANPTVNNIKDAAKLAYAISQIKTPSSFINKKINAGKCIYTSILKRSKVTKIDNSFIQYAEKNIGKIKITFSHGDFSPWHIYKRKNNFILIDTEHSGKNPKYYDIANFYIRLRENLKNKKFANLFIQEYINLLSSEEKTTFWSEFKPVLIERVIGSLWEIDTNHFLGKGVNKTSCKKLLNNILYKDQFLN